MWLKKSKEIRLPLDYSDLIYKDLSNRLRVQADNVCKEGYLNAYRLMLNAADLIDDLVEQGLIYVDKSDVETPKEEKNSGW